MLQGKDRWLLELNEVNMVIRWFMSSRPQRIVVVSTNVYYPAEQKQDSISPCAANRKSKVSSQLKSG